MSKYICTGDSCCLIPNYLIEKKNNKQCENYSICFNQIDKNDDFCKDCLNLPYENKKRIIEKAKCSSCSKINNISIKREECQHFLCVNCFRKIFFNKTLSRPVFPYKDCDEKNTNDDSDLNILNYKKQLDYWNVFQNIDHEYNKICRECPVII